MNATFAWRNRLLTAVLTAGSQVPGLEVQQLQNDQGSPDAAWQTAQGVVTSAAGAWFMMDFGVEVVCRAFSLHRLNLTSAGTVRVRVGNDPSFATWISDSGPRPGPAAGYGQVVIVFPEAGEPGVTIVTEAGVPVTLEDPAFLLTAETGARGRYCRIDIEDPGNPDGHINVPLAYIGPAWTPHRNYGYDSAPGAEADLQVVTTRGGQEFADLRWRRRVWDIALPSIRPDEVWDRVMDLHLAALDGRNVLFVPAPTGDEVYRQAIFGRLTPQSSITYPQKTPALRSWRARITERL